MSLPYLSFGFQINEPALRSTRLVLQRECENRAALRYGVLSLSSVGLEGALD